MTASVENKNCTYHIQCDTYLNFGLINTDEVTTSNTEDDEQEHTFDLEGEEDSEFDA